MAVTGIGGLFFRARDPEALKRWYCEHLGVGCGDWGTWDQQAGTTVFSPFPADTDYFPAERQWMLNLRVDELDDLLANLRAADIDVITTAVSVYKDERFSDHAPLIIDYHHG